MLKHEQVLMRYDGEGVNGPGFSGGNLNQLHEDMVHKQTPGGPGYNDEINSAGGTVTSIASARSDSKSIGRRKSSSRKSSVASRDGDAAPGLPEDNHVGDVNAAPSDNKNKKRKDKKKKRKKRVKSHESGLDDAKERELKEDEDPDQVNINIKAMSMSKPKKKKKSKRKMSMNDKLNSGPASLSNLSKKIEKEKSKKKKLKEAEKKKKSEEKKQKIKEQMEDDEDMMEMGLEDLVSSDSSSSSEDFILWKTDEDEVDNNRGPDTIHEYRLDAKGKYVEDTRDGVTNNLANYVELKIVKYPGTGELFMVITKFDDKKDASEVFRTDFVRCLNIEKNQIEEDFTIYFENLTMIFRADDYQRANAILINLRALFEQHCANIQPALPTPPPTTVTDQMGLFLGGL